MDTNRIAETYLTVAHHVFSTMLDDVEAFAGEVVASLKAGGKLMICGNGGSAGDAQHIAGEFVNRFLKEREPYAAIALTTDSSILTCISNDYDYNQVFAKQVEALGRPGDILLGISTSGNAGNVLAAFASAKAKGVRTVALTGGSGGKLAAAADRVLSISCTTETPRIQEGHLLLYHLFCERIEERMTEGEGASA